MRRQQSESSGSGLLVVRSRVPPRLLTEYHAWYDGLHVPARIGLPGWRTARRYVAAGDSESFLAYYDLESVSVLGRQPYVSMREDRPAAEQRILGLIPPMDRRVYRGAAPRGPTSACPPTQLNICGPLLLCVWWEPAPDAVEEFNGWYDQEHIPMLSQIPGWLRSRRFQLVEGGGPAFLAMHDLASEAVFDHPGYTCARSTTRRAAAVAHRVGYERVLYRLLRRFDTPSATFPDRS